jgi:hypothetical protein
VTFRITLMKILLTTTKLTSLNNTKSFFFGNGGHHPSAFGNNKCFLTTRSPWSQLMLQLHLFLPHWMDHEFMQQVMDGSNVILMDMNGVYT